jgi:hypothetical protein
LEKQTLTDVSWVRTAVPKLFKFPGALMLSFKYLEHFKSVFWVAPSSSSGYLFIVTAMRTSNPTPSTFYFCMGSFN